jgi:N-acyl-D-amino-acid deacylase
MKLGTVLLACTICHAQDYDLLIRGGRVVDGTGNPSYIADVGIKEGRIAALGPLAGRTAAQTIDAASLTVAPGFIDIHNHSDFTVVQDGNAESMVRQGVTSMIFGEGGSAAPSARWKDFDAYFTQLMKQGISTNIGTYVGSSEIWTRVHGEKAGPPAAAELEQMRHVVKEAMEQGALGVASSLAGRRAHGSIPIPWWRCVRSSRGMAGSTRPTCARKAGVFLNRLRRRSRSAGARTYR